MTRLAYWHRALRKQAALIAALALLLAHLPALAASTVRVTLRPSVTLGLVSGHNDTWTLDADVMTTDGSAAPPVTWRSIPAETVVVDLNGRLTAKKFGTAVIYATAGTATARCVVNVRRLPVKALTLNKTKIALFSRRDGFQLISKPTPANADNPSVTWSSSNPSVAKVDRLTGYVTPLKPGVAVIRCRAADGTQKKAYCTVVVKPVLPTALILSAASLEINVGATTRLDAIVSPADATDQRVIWHSTNPEIASVKDGVVTGHKFGKATIVARTRAGNIAARCAVSVGYYTTAFRALVIGQEEYRNGIMPLEGPHNDAGLVRSMLVNADFGGGKNVNVTLLENLSASGIRSALNQMASWGVDADDVTYFYYSGHGDKDGSLVGVDGGAVPVDVVRQYLDRLPGTVVVIIDSCYSGWFIRSKSPVAAENSSADPDAITSRVVSAFGAAGKAAGLEAKTSLAASVSALGKYRILTACASTESSYIVSGDVYAGASLFTYHLATGSGVQAASWGAAPGMPADANRNGVLTLNELFQYTKTRVRANSVLKKARVRQSVRMWPAGSSFPVVQRTP